MSKITIADLEVFYCVGVTDEERARPQRLLITLEMSCDFTSATVSDRIERTIDYFEVARELLKFGDGRSWKLLEKLAANVADMVLLKFRPLSVSVEIKKFSIPQARHVAVSLSRARPQF